MNLTAARRLADRLMSFRAPLDPPVDHETLQAAWDALDLAYGTADEQPADLARREVLIAAR